MSKAYKTRGFWMPIEVMTRTDLSLAEKVILARIMAYGDKGCSLQIKDLAAMLGLSFSSVKARIQALIHKDLIQKTGTKRRRILIFIGPKNSPMEEKLGLKNNPNSIHDRVKKEPYEGQNLALSASPPITPPIDNKRKQSPPIVPPQPDSPPKGKAKPPIDPQEFVRYWNAKEVLPIIRQLTGSRLDRLRKRCREAQFRHHWRTVVDKLADSPFHTGENDRGWKATVDWILKNDTNYLKILELETYEDQVRKALGIRHPTPEEARKLLGLEDEHAD
ncbi:MAG: hypothetical protein JXA82_18220 [Sedimentisphaerales bacterium]|nr:hypothetical protein [Sedimentisphaerales bacterium]